MSFLEDAGTRISGVFMITLGWVLILIGLLFLIARYWILAGVFFGIGLILVIISRARIHKE